jgi:pyruvate-ferredoxin/flavodoxin oxidoreductase
MGSSDAQTVKAFLEADSFQGPSLIIAYSHCISHGINMTNGLEQQRKAVATGAWPLFRYDPRLAAQGKNPLQIDSKEPSMKLDEYISTENRWKMLYKINPDEAKRLAILAQQDVLARWAMLKHWAAMPYGAPAAPAAEAPKE